MKELKPEDFAATYELVMGYEIGLVGEPKTTIKGAPLKLITIEEAARQANWLVRDQAGSQDE